MAFSYRISDRQNLYFVTATVRQWADVFTRPAYAGILPDSFRFAQQNRAMYVYDRVIMSNHFHAILPCGAPYELSSVLRDMKKYTSAQITDAIRNNLQESRRSRLLWLLKNDGGGI